MVSCVCVYTGTRAGMTIPQETGVERVIDIIKPTKGVHGGAVGGDEEYHQICKRKNIPIEVYPCPVRDIDWPGAVRHPAKPPLKRNDTMIKIGHFLIAAPVTSKETQRGGTWYTIRRARKQKLPHVVVNPDGSFVFHNGINYSSPTRTPPADLIRLCLLPALRWKTTSAPVKRRVTANPTTDMPPTTTTPTTSTFDTSLPIT